MTKRWTDSWFVNHCNNDERANIFDDAPFQWSSSIHRIQWNSESFHAEMKITEIDDPAGILLYLFSFMNGNMHANVFNYSSYCFKIAKFHMFYLENEGQGHCRIGCSSTILSGCQIAKQCQKLRFPVQSLWRNCKNSEMLNVWPWISRDKDDFTDVRPHNVHYRHVSARQINSLSMFIPFLNNCKMAKILTVWTWK